MENITQIWYELSQGEGSKMYTLWRVTQSPQIFNRLFIQNLSIDKEQALAKAKTLVGDRELHDDSLDSLRQIIRSDSGLISFGKYHGTKVIELPDGYLSWVAQGGPVSESEDEYSYTRFLASEFETKIALEEAIKRNLFVEFEGKFIPASLRDYIIEDREGWGFHFPNKEKVKLHLECIKISGFSTQYGYTNIYTFKELKTGRKFQYKGAQTLQLKHFYEDSTIKYYYKNISVGENCILTGTIKLEEYRSREVSYIQRVKILQ